MCRHFPGQPYRIVLDRRQDSRNGRVYEAYTYALGKVTGVTRSGDHITSNNFIYPIGQFAWDNNAIVYDHDRCLHFLPSLEYANEFSSFNSHRLLVLPSPRLWDEPDKYNFTNPRCWHADGCMVLCCIDCLGLTLDDLQNDQCWRDLTKPRRQYALPAEPNNGSVVPVDRNNIWHEFESFDPNSPMYYMRR
jgi:hypothetical protein